MFLIKIFHFAKGYVILSVSGNNKDEFIGALASEGAHLRGVTYCGDSIRAELPLDEFYLIRQIRVRTDLHICEKHGIVFVMDRLRRRKGFLIGMCAFLLAFIIGSQFVWTITYEGVSEQNMAQVSEAVRLAGLREGVWKHSLRAPLEMKNIILGNTDGICWAWVYINGTKAVVRVHEDILPPEIFDPDTPCDIIAMRSGIIKRVITERGRCLAAENMSVAPGDVIISGTYEFEDKPGYQVHSRGTVEAVCEHSRTGVYKQVYCSKKYTGRVRRFASAGIFGWKIPLSFGKPGFENYDSEVKYYGIDLIGIGLKTTVCREYTVTKEPISYDAAVELAKNELEREISKELLQPAQLTEKHADVQKIDEETVSVTVTMTFIEQIGTEKKIDEVEFIEPKTDNTAAGD